MQEFKDGPLLLIKVGPLGPYGNNSYVVADSGSRDAWVVDAPIDSEKVFPHLEGLHVKGIAITHRHEDHWAGVEPLSARAATQVYCHAEDSTGRKIARTLTDGEDIEIGVLKMRVLFTPGHTPGSICFLVGDHLISGDTLFQGGPGRTANPESLKQELDSITAKLLKLPQSTLVHPGHGDDTSIADTVREYAIFASKSHPPDLAGDVTWLG